MDIGQLVPAPIVVEQRAEGGKLRQSFISELVGDDRFLARGGSELSCAHFGPLAGKESRYLNQKIRR